MTSLRLRCAAAAVALLLVGCAVPAGHGEAGAPAGLGGAGKPAPAKPTPSPTNQKVRKLPLTDLVWADVLRGKDVTLSAGKATDGEFTYQVRDDVVYADANGDGQEDAFALLERTQGKTKVTFGYVWLYDVATNKPVQVKDPVGDWNACGDSLVSVGPGTPGGFELAEKLRDVYDHQACGTEPLHPRTRTIVVSEGRLVMTKPYLAYGGICYQTQQQADDFRREVPIRVWPDVKADVVDRAQHLYKELPTHAERTWPDGWAQVSWVTPQMAKDNAHWGICGFVWIK